MNKKLLLLVCAAMLVFSQAGLAFAATNATQEAATITTNATEAAKAVAPEAAKAPAQDRLSKAIAATPIGTGAGQIDPAAAPGFLNIPGAPQVNPVLAFAWAVWVGWIFSTVGAFGGVMAGVGHMSVFGLGQYASSFGKGAPLNKLVTDSIRVSNQWLTGFSSAVSTFKYASMGRIVFPLGFALGVGSVVGSILIPMLTQGNVSFKQYQGFFGLFVLGLGCYLFYETTPMAQAKRKKGAEAAKAFENATKNADGGKAATGVKIVSVTARKVVFTFCGVEFSFNTFLPMIGGFIIASVASFLGVGGGFLLVPFLTSISQLPMYLAAGTSALAVLIGMITSISTFMAGGTPVYWSLVGVEIAGIILGSWVGPMTARFLPDKWLKRIFIVLAFVVGIDFVMRGFFNLKLW